MKYLTWSNIIITNFNTIMITSDVHVHNIKKRDFDSYFLYLHLLCFV